MYETFRMIGALHEADLEREAAKRHLAAAFRAVRPSRDTKRRKITHALGWFSALSARIVPSSQRHLRSSANIGSPDPRLGISPDAVRPGDA